MPERNSNQRIDRCFRILQNGPRDELSASKYESKLVINIKADSKRFHCKLMKTNVGPLVRNGRIHILKKVDQLNKQFSYGFTQKTGN